MELNASPLFAAPHHPLLIQAGADNSVAGLHAFIVTHREALHKLCLAHGALLLRGFALRNADEFHASVRQFDALPYAYVGGNSPRTRVAHEVFTSTEYPASQVISLHNEMSYLPHWPRRLFFFSQTPAASGGQTSLASSLDVLQAMPAALLERLRAKRVRYIRYFDPALKLGKTWQATYLTEDRDELAQILAAQQSDCHWSADGKLRISTTCDAFATHPETGQEAWFNQIEQWHPSALPPKVRAVYEAKGMLAHGCEFGDGEPFEEAMLDTIREVTNAHKLLFDWQQGDLLMVDNILTMHGREAFSGQRSTLAYLAAN